MLVAAVVFLLVISPLASKPDLVKVVSALAELVCCQLKLGVNLYENVSVTFWSIVLPKLCCWFLLIEFDVEILLN